MILAKLTEYGMAGMEQFLDSLNTDSPEDWPEYMLHEREYSEVLPGRTKVRQLDFESRFDLAVYVDEILEQAGLVGSPGSIPTELWAWLGLCWFEQICGKQEDGTYSYKAGERARWIPALDNFRKKYRHLVAGPWLIYNANRDKPERARCILSQRPGRPGELAEQIVNRTEILTNSIALETATRLYVDPSSGELRKGAAGKDGGSVRRYTTVLSQYDLTHDLRSLSVDQLVELLPDEFSRFRDQAG